jgi:hypothetical protein
MTPLTGWIESPRARWAGLGNAQLAGDEGGRELAGRNDLTVR